MNGSEHKDRGNAHFKNEEYVKALGCYARALADMDVTTDGGQRVPIHRNRSLCFLKLGQVEDAIREALKACVLDLSNIKSLYRLSLALKEAGLYEEALEVALLADKNSKCALRCQLYNLFLFVDLGIALKFAIRVQS
jgi:tetratricopeptide (TPR) repeat protein